MPAYCSLQFTFKAPQQSSLGTVYPYLVSGCQFGGVSGIIKVINPNGITLVTGVAATAVSGTYRAECYQNAQSTSPTCFTTANLIITTPNGRLEAPETDCTVPTQVAMSRYLEHLLGYILNSTTLFNDETGALSKVKIREVLPIIVEVLSTQYSYDFGVAIDYDGLATSLFNGRTSAITIVANGLTKGVSGTILREQDYNMSVISQYPTVVDKIKQNIPKPLIIFANGHWSKIVPGPSYGGNSYWDYNNPDRNIFFNNTAKYFNVNDYGKAFADGSSLFGFDTDFRDRKIEGYKYAANNYMSWKKQLNNYPIYIIAHSEGCGMAAGIADYLTEKNEKIGEMVLLSCDEGRELGANLDPLRPKPAYNPNIPTYQIEYMYWDKTLLGGNCEPKCDWVVGTNSNYQTYAGIQGVSKFGIVVKNYLGYTSVHGSTGGTTNRTPPQITPIFNDLNALKNTQAVYYWNGGLPYYSQTGGDVSFFKINDKIIITSNPQWNTQTKMVDYSLPCIPK